MTAEIIKLPEQQAEQEQHEIEEIELVEADLKLRAGTLTITQKRKREKKADAAEAKTANERQKAFVEARKAAGFKKDWIHADVLQLAEEAGGQEKIAEMLDAQRAVQRDLIQQQKAEIAELKAQLADAAGRVSVVEITEKKAAELERKMQQIPRWIQRLFR